MPHRRLKLWTSLSSLALMQAMPAALAEDGAAEDPAQQTPPLFGQYAGEGEGEGGEGEGEGGEGEGGEGEGEGEGPVRGEEGIDPARAAEDPVAFLTALEVIRAHYLAGLAAYDAGLSDAAAELFAHPIAEIYVDLEPVFEDQGVTGFGETMTAAADAVLEREPVQIVHARAEAVLEAVDAAASQAPNRDRLDSRARARLLADLLERSALQYRLATDDPDPEVYIDGFGYYRAARVRSERDLAAIYETDRDLARAVERALATLGRAYGSIERPAEFDVDPGDALAASSAVRLMLRP